jgi:hypothetical protein
MPLCLPSLLLLPLLLLLLLLPGPPGAGVQPLQLPLSDPDPRGVNGREDRVLSGVQLLALLLIPLLLV